MSPKTEASKPSPAAPKGARKQITKLDDRGKRLVELMVYGAEPEEAETVDAKPHSPLTLEQAAMLIGVKLRNARYLFSQRAFLAEYSSALSAMRTSHKARAVRVLADVMTDKGGSLAADRAVQTKAATALLGADAAESKPVLVSVGVQLAAGVVIRLPPGVAAPPLEEQQAAPQRSPYPLRTDPTTMLQTCIPCEDDDEVEK